MNSRKKGKRGELELARTLSSYGYDCRRGVQYKGGTDSPDVVGLPHIHIECKRVERLNLDDAFSQAKRDAGDKIPSVFHRKNNGDWMVTMRLSDWIELYREWEAGYDSERGERDHQGISGDPERDHAD